MKNIIILFASVFFMGCSASTNAQNSETETQDSKVKETAKDVKDGVVEGAQEVKEAGKDIGNKTAEVAVKGVAKIKDKELKNKVGPDGQAIYEDKYGNYYYVNDKGRKIYLTKARLKDKE